MCLAVPGKVIKIDGRKATVQYTGEARFAMVADIVPVVGDMVMVQMGVIMKKLSNDEAESSIKAWNEVEEKQKTSN